MNLHPDPVPSDTTNLLAWNGGGKANYSEIVSDGGYKVISKTIDLSLPSMEDVKEEVENANRKFHAGSEKLESKLEALAEQLEDFIADEMEDFFEEFKRHRASKASM